MEKVKILKREKEIKNAAENGSLYRYFTIHFDDWNKSDLQNIILALQTIIDINSVANDEVLHVLKRFKIISEI